eukprot:GHVS01004004.1.p1 GENE.GHVS01004004.1~~GHVS01004004.1.p1  ORF type:complete len:664 (-),score=147.56 GHVS01004004.1:277-2268(-)
MEHQRRPRLGLAKKTRVLLLSRLMNLSVFVVTLLIVAGCSSLHCLSLSATTTTTDSSSTTDSSPTPPSSLSYSSSSYSLLSLFRPLLPLAKAAIRSVGMEGPASSTLLPHNDAQQEEAVKQPAPGGGGQGGQGRIRAMVYNAMPDGSDEVATWKTLYSMFSSFFTISAPAPPPGSPPPPATTTTAPGPVVSQRRLMSLPNIPDMPALPLKLSLGTWLPDWSLINEDTAEQLPSLLYYVTMLFMQESLLFNAKELFRSPAVPAGLPQTDSATLKDIQIITADSGFGSSSNHYVFKLLEFKGGLYASTLNFKSREGLDGFFLGLPFFSEGGEIWAGRKTEGEEGSQWSWTNAVKDGLGSNSNGGVRNMVTYGEYIFAVTLNHVLGFELWRSVDGVAWTAEVRLGLGNRFNSSGRGVAVWKGHLYLGVENRSTGAQLWRRKLTVDGDWAEDSRWDVIAHGNGKGGLLTNFWFSDFVEFKGNLYVGTMNFLGLEIWRVSTAEDSADEDAVDFERVYKGSPTEQGRGVSQMRVFHGDTLFVGTMFRMPKGAALLSSTDGVNFQTHQPPVNIPGLPEEKHFIYLWSMVEYNGRMYVSANEWTTEKQGFVLFSFVDPNAEWTVETATAFGYAPMYYGIRSMTEYDGQLLMGSAGIEPCVVFSATANEAPS